jgi:hypothetical protein
VEAGRRWRGAYGYYYNLHADRPDKPPHGPARSGQPTSASGQNAGATVYVVGQQNSAITTDSNGNFNLTVNPALSGTVLSSPSFFSRLFKAAATVQSYGLVVISAGSSHGRKIEITLTDGNVDPISTIYINTVGTISGKAFLANQTDHRDHGLHPERPSARSRPRTAAIRSATRFRRLRLCEG